MSRRKRKIGTSALEELLAIAEEQFQDRGGVDLRPSAYDHLARFSKNNPKEFYKEIADALCNGAYYNDGKMRYFYYINESGQRVNGRC